MKEKISAAAKLLLPALRQYQHNDGSGLLAGYDTEVAERIVAALMVSPAPSAEVEAVEVVAVAEGEGGLPDRCWRGLKWAPGMDPMDVPANSDLMTVAQHSRIVAAKDAEIAHLRSARDAYGQNAIDLQREVMKLRAQPARQVGGDEREYHCDYAGCSQKAHPGTSLCLEHHTPKARAALAQPARQVGDDWPKLDKPAKVGGGRFNVGVSARLVVEAAQRQYEYDVTPEKEADRIAKAAGFLGSLQGGRQVGGDEREHIRELIAKGSREGTDRNYLMYILDRIHDALYRDEHVPKSAALAPTAVGPEQGEWERCQQLADLPAVHEVLDGFQADPTGDNGVMVVREVLRAALTPAAVVMPSVEQIWDSVPEKQRAESRISLEHIGLVLAEVARLNTDRSAQGGE